MEEEEAEEIEGDDASLEFGNDAAGTERTPFCVIWNGTGTVLVDWCDDLTGLACLVLFCQYKSSRVLHARPQLSPAPRCGRYKQTFCWIEATVPNAGTS